MADITALQDFAYNIPMTNANPKLTLAQKITSSATSIELNFQPLDEDGNTITKALYLGIKKSNGYIEPVYAASGISGTTVVVTRNVKAAGLDLTATGQGGAVSHEAGEEVLFLVAPFYFNQMKAAMDGTVASGGADWKIGTESDVDITVYAANGDANEPFWRYDASENEWVFSNDGVSSTPFGTGSGVTGGTNIDVTAGTISLETTLTGNLTLSGNTTLSDVVELGNELRHVGDTDNKIAFTTDTQTYSTGGGVRMTVGDAGVQFGGANATITTILDEDAMGSDSATSLATQQSIKAYVDTQVATVNDKQEITTADVSVTNTTSETNLFQSSIAANTLGTNNGVRLYIPVKVLSSAGGGNDCTIRVKYGSTTMITQQYGGDGQTGDEGYIEIYLTADAATGAQAANFFSIVAPESQTAVSTSLVFFLNSTGTASEDSTGALNLTVTAQWNIASASNVITVGRSVSTIIR